MTCDPFRRRPSLRLEMAHSIQSVDKGQGWGGYYKRGPETRLGGAEAESVTSTD